MAWCRMTIMVQAFATVLLHQINEEPQLSFLWIICQWEEAQEVVLRKTKVYMLPLYELTNAIRLAKVEVVN